MDRISGQADGTVMTAREWLIGRSGVRCGLQTQIVHVHSSGELMQALDGEGPVAGDVVWLTELFCRSDRVGLPGLDDDQVRDLSCWMCVAVGLVMCLWWLIGREASTRGMVVSCWRTLAADLACLLADHPEMQQIVAGPDDRWAEVEVLIRPAAVGMTESPGGLLEGLAVEWVVLATLQLAWSGRADREYLNAAWEKLRRGLEVPWVQMRQNAENAATATGGRHGQPDGLDGREKGRRERDEQ